MAERKTTRKTTKKSTDQADEKPARKKKSATTTKKSTASKKSTTSKRKTTASKPRRSSTSSRSATLSSDLKKFDEEQYETTEMTHGAMLMVQSEGIEILREAALALFASKIPLVGEKLGSDAVAGITRKLSDDYKKLAAGDRKAMRGVIRWLNGSYEVDSETASRLTSAFSSPTLLNPLAKDVPKGITEALTGQ